MGIPGLFNQFIKGVKGAVRDNFPLFVSSLALDLNGVFHEARNSVLGDNTTDKEVLNAISRTSSDQIDLEIRIKVLAIILDVINKIKPHDTLLLCVDGPAPQAKLQQQKIRRQGSIPNAKFDGNAITPGTEFMMRLHNDLIVFIERSKLLLPPKVIYSSHLVPGEGEHKIMDYYRGEEVKNGLAAKKGGNHVIYGLDSDLIMLSLVSPLRNIFLYQERPEIDYRSQQYVNKRYIINIGAIKRSLLDKRKNPIVINDFVVMCFLIGNDFLPHFPVFKNIGKTLVEFVDIYFENEFTLTKIDDEDEPSINWEGFNKFMNILASQEGDRLIKLAEKNDKLDYPSRFIESSIKLDSHGKEVFSNKDYRSYWYNNALGYSRDPELTDQLKSILGEDMMNMDRDDVNKMINNYLLLVAWNYLYYTKGTSAINMDLTYLYHHSPMLKDLSVILSQPEFKISGYKAKDQTIKFTALHQLVAVMPLRSKDLLPIELKPLFSYDSIIRDIFPDTFIIEMDGIEKETQKHQGLAIIPFVDRRRIYDAVFQINFSPERAKIWLPHKDRKSERTESLEEKSARDVAFSEYKNIRELSFNNRNQPEQKSLGSVLTVKEVPISKENKAILEYSEILSSFGIELGTNNSENRFVSSEKTSFINNRLTQPNSLLSNTKQNNELISRDKNKPKQNNEPISRGRNEPISRTRDEPISRGRNEPISRTREEPISRGRNEPISRGRDEPISRSRDEPISRTRDEPISRTRDEPISRTRDEPISRSRDEPISRSRDEPISRSRDEPISRSRDKPISRTRDEPISRTRDEPISRSKDEPISRGGDETISTNVKKTLLQIPPKINSQNVAANRVGKTTLLPVPTLKKDIKK